MFVRRYACLALIFIAASFKGLAAASLLEEAETLAETGKTAQAITRYRAFLDASQGHPRYASALLAASSLEPNAAKALDLLKRYQKNPSPLPDKSQIFKRMAALSELLGDIKSAETAYRAAYLNSFPPDYDSYLKAGFLDLEMGEEAKAGQAAEIVLAKKQLAPQVRLKAITLALTAYTGQNLFTRGQLLLEREDRFLKARLNAPFLYAAHNFYAKQGDLRKKEAAKNTLLHKFSQTPEAMLIKKAAQAYPSPALLWQ